MPKLTKKVVEKAAPDAMRDSFIWDSTLPGFGLRLYSSGARKYVVQYRTKGNRQRRFALGAHGVLTTEQARDMARNILADVSRGRDPAAERRAAREAPTVRDLARDYLDRHAIPNKRPASVADDEAMLDRVILPKLGPAKLRKAHGHPDVVWCGSFYRLRKDALLRSVEEDGLAPRNLADRELESLDASRSMFGQKVVS
jgi:hypothetical protein